MIIDTDKPYFEDKRLPTHKNVACWRGGREVYEINMEHPYNLREGIYWIAQRIKDVGDESLDPTLVSDLNKIGMRVGNVKRKRNVKDANDRSA